MATMQPFTWGAGGRRMTPEQIEQERAIAASLMQNDYSPVQHWTQGLARVAGNLTGAFRQKKADKAALQNQDFNRSITEALLAPPELAPPGSEVPVPGGTLLPSTGRPMLPNSDGTFSTEESITITDPRINGGAPTNIPSIWGGKRYASEEDAVVQALASGQAFSSFPTIDEAVAAAKARSDKLGGEVDALTRPTQRLGVMQAIAEALSSPYADPATRKLAMERFEGMNKRAEPIEVNGKLIDPTTFEVIKDYSTQDVPEIVDLARIANDPMRPEFEREAAKARIVALNDPILNLTTPQGQFIGPRSELVILNGGGAPAPSGLPTTLPPDFDFNDGGQTPPASGSFR